MVLLQQSTEPSWRYPYGYHKESRESVHKDGVVLQSVAPETTPEEIPFRPQSENGITTIRNSLLPPLLFSQEKPWYGPSRRRTSPLTTLGPDHHRLGGRDVRSRHSPISTEYDRVFSIKKLKVLQTLDKL